jgi:hypothetical protein
MRSAFCSRVVSYRLKFIIHSRNGPSRGRPFRNEGDQLGGKSAPAMSSPRADLAGTLTLEDSGTIVAGHRRLQSIESAGRDRRSFKFSRWARKIGTLIDFSHALFNLKLQISHSLV